MKPVRAFLLTGALALAAGAALLNCTPSADDADPLTEDQLTGVNNALGLGLRYDEATGTIQATMKQPLDSDEQLYIRLRRGKITLDSQSKLDCSELTHATLLPGGKREALGKVVFQGPPVDKSIFNLVHLYDDARWATGDVPAQVKEDVQNLGPDPIVEACVMHNGQPRAKLQTNLAYAWDQKTKDTATEQQSQGLHVSDVDSGGGNGGTDGVGEDNVQSQIEYGKLCVEQMGEIPFFKKLADGKYDTFDCRHLVGTNAQGSTGAIAGVEGAHIPVTVNGVAQDKCSPGRELGLNQQDYDCMDKADHGMFLASGGVQPGPMVVTAENAQGTHWVLLCRKVSDDGSGMTNSTVFNDMAMIGHNPKTGRTCFFQNSIGSGRDGVHVPHPADVEKSTTVWSPQVQSYCSGSCHGESAFVHSPWIDGALGSNGKPIVPKVGELPDFPISTLDAPYNIVAADHLGFALPKQLVSDEVGACNNCHRLAGNTLGQFANWSTGTGDDYYGHITDFGKQFGASHWMPPLSQGVTGENWNQSKFGLALTFMAKCTANGTDPSCLWADVPRGAFNNPAVR